MSANFKRIFICSHPSDHYSAAVIYQYLTERGHACWLSSEATPSGMEYFNAVNEAIRSSDIFIILLSNRTQSNPEIIRELELAANSLKRIIPLRLEPCPIPDSVGRNLVGTQVVNTEGLSQDDLSLIAQLVDGGNKPTVRVNAPISVSDQNNYSDRDSLDSVSDHTSYTVKQVKRKKKRTGLKAVLIILAVLIGLTAIAGAVVFIAKPPELMYGLYNTFAPVTKKSVEGESLYAMSVNDYIQRYNSNNRGELTSTLKLSEFETGLNDNGIAYYMALDKEIVLFSVSDSPYTDLMTVKCYSGYRDGKLPMTVVYEIKALYPFLSYDKIKSELTTCMSTGKRDIYDVTVEYAYDNELAAQSWYINPKQTAE